MGKCSKLRKNQKGITLISLIVAIVIILILAAVLINVSFKNVNIVGTATDSSKLYAIEQYQGTIEEGMQKAILEETIIGEEIDQDSIKEELNQIRRYSKCILF